MKSQVGKVATCSGGNIRRFSVIQDWEAAFLFLKGNTATDPRERRMHINLETLEYVIVTIVFGAIGGAVSGAFVADFFANQRARKTRKIDLIAFLNTWLSEIIAYRTKYSDHGLTTFTAVVEEFEDTRLQMVAKAAVVELDYKGSDRTQFTALVNVVAQTTPDVIKDPQGRASFADLTKNLASFVENSL